MTEAVTPPSHCLWCRFHPDTRKVFVFFIVLAALVAVARGVEEPSAKSAATRPHKKHIRVVPLATKSEKRPVAVESPFPLLIEKEPTR